MKNLPLKSLVLAIIIAMVAEGRVRADLASKAAQETAEFVLKKFGKKVLTEGTETFAERISASVLRHGDDVISAVRRVGPSALSLADEAGEQAPKILRLLSKHGDDAAVWVAQASRCHEVAVESMATTRRRSCQTQGPC